MVNTGVIPLLLNPETFCSKVILLSCGYTRPTLHSLLRDVPHFTKDIWLLSWLSHYTLVLVNITLKRHWRGKLRKAIRHLQPWNGSLKAVKSMNQCMFSGFHQRVKTNILTAVFFCSDSDWSPLNVTWCDLWPPPGYILSTSPLQDQPVWGKSCSFAQRPKVRFPIISANCNTRADVLRSDLWTCWSKPVSYL